MGDVAARQAPTCIAEPPCSCLPSCSAVLPPSNPANETMAAVLAGLKSVDFYRKLKRDLQQELTEASIAGAALSVCAALFMIGLVIAEFSAYMSVSTDSKVILDHFDSSSDDTLQVNFNISFPHLKCEYASVDATNFMGTHDAGLGKRVSKVRLGGSGKSLGRYDDGKIQSNIRHVMDE